jgi:diamine N-acetyltransferase
MHITTALIVMKSLVFIRSIYNMILSSEHDSVSGTLMNTQDTIYKSRWSITFSTATFANMATIVNATPAHIPTIIDLAQKTWWPTYSPILEKEQLEYMLGTIYSTTALEKVMTEGSQTFMLLSDDRGWQGFAAYGVRNEESDVYKLHKLYVLPDNQGKGYGKLLLEEVKRRVAAKGASALDLNVNRHNPAKGFYEKLGFKVTREEDVPIGPYWMNDYVMRLMLK